MPLLPGRQNMNANYHELMKGVQSAGREKAVTTIMRKRGVNRDTAMAIQAAAIVRSKASKRN